jgi:hypothetical protein
MDFFGEKFFRVFELPLLRKRPKNALKQNALKQKLKQK